MIHYKSHDFQLTTPAHLCKGASDFFTGTFQACRRGRWGLGFWYSKCGFFGWNTPLTLQIHIQPSKPKGGKKCCLLFTNAKSLINENRIIYQKFSRDRCCVCWSMHVFPLLTHNLKPNKVDKWPFSLFDVNHVNSVRLRLWNMSDHTSFFTGICIFACIPHMLI